MNFFKKLFGLNQNKKKDTHNFNFWEVQNIIKETSDAVSLVFNKPENFVFQAGQYLTFKKKYEGQEVRRSYSFSSSPDEELLKVTIKKTPSGGFSKFICDELIIGDKLEVMGPNGNFTVPVESSKNYVAFAGGSGITPIMSAIKTVLTNNSNTFHLFYGNKNQDSVIFKKQLQDLVESSNNALKVTNIFETIENEESEYNGFIDSEKIDIFSKKYFDISEVDYFLICGPGGMIGNINDKLLEIGVKKNKIKYELFTPLESKPLSNDVKIITPSILNINFNNNYHTIEYNNSKKTILDFVLESNIELPYSCKSGNCGTCIAKLNKGKVHSSSNTLGLTEDQIKNNYILTCVSYPLEKEISLDFEE